MEIVSAFVRHLSAFVDFISKYAINPVRLVVRQGGQMADKTLNLVRHLSAIALFLCIIRHLHQFYDSKKGLFSLFSVISHFAC
jgi:hypothetical protein